MSERSPLPPTWARALLRRLAPPDLREEVLGDLEEAHRERTRIHGPRRASLLTALEALDMARALLRERRRSRRSGGASAHPGARLSRSERAFASISWLDVKLGLRMLVKHPALSVVSTLGIAVGVAIGAVGFGVIGTLTTAELPLDEGDRVVAIQNAASSEQSQSTHLHDLATWRAEVRALTDLGAYRIVARNLVAADGRVEPASVVEMTAAGFRVARVPPLLGRHLVEEDEREGAPHVVVIGYGVWQDRFGGSQNVIGQTLRLGSTQHTVVGVMPREFAFPINNRIWTPLRLDPSDFQPGAAPHVAVFARLAPGYTLEEAQVQLAAVGERAAALDPRTYEGLRPRVFAYTHQALWGELSWLLWILQAGLSLILLVIAVNVAALVYARTATRAGEIVVRSALGASRSRIAWQLFIEAFVLSSAAAVLGLVAARIVLRQVDLLVSVSSGELKPFWQRFDLSASTVLYAFGLAAVAAFIIGVVPALGATKRQLRGGLQKGGSTGGRLELGRVWTALIVAQVAVAVAVLPIPINGAFQLFASFLPGPATTTGDYLWLSLDVDQEALSAAATPAQDPATPAQNPRVRYAQLQDEVLRRLEADPAVSAVVRMRPAPWQDPDLRTEVEDMPSTHVADPTRFHLPTGTNAGWTRVGTGFFEGFTVPLVAGRYFEPQEYSADANVVIVGTTFVDRVLGGGAAVGRRIRPGSANEPWGLGAAAGSWYTIVGVVPDFPRQVSPLRPEPKVYQPLPPESAERMSFAVEVRGADPASFAPRVREIIDGVDPALRPVGMAPLDEILSRGGREIVLVSAGAASLALAVLLLSVAGLYALMSFTIVQRRREIGIRSALGARPDRILASVLSRSMRQLALGILLGVTLVGLMDGAIGGTLLSGRRSYLLPAVALLMVVVGVAAAWGPARRGLRVQPTEALRAE